jgi:hypothetical protein
MSTPNATTTTNKPKRERKAPGPVSATEAIGAIGKLLERVPENDRKRVIAFFTVG